VSGSGGGGGVGTEGGDGALDEVNCKPAHWPGGVKNLELSSVPQHETHGSVITKCMVVL